ncbi:hypothetical protein [Catellatospora sichuanensis]|uniref:hypothetical protein n=1 Tax=Catellatospora sichuanensis TaxID=1969805 RepID=UPI0011841100|nr:hypothetical protein [Catellatospora sichuanensis]
MAIVFPVEVDRFIVAATQLSADDIDRVDEARMEVFRAHGRLPAPKLSAAAFSKLDGRIRADLRARGPQFWSYRVGAISGAIGATLKAAAALWKPEQLTAEQYRLTVHPFELVGLPVRAHPDESADD